jgi:phage/plasmid-associated DNA primase
MSIYNEFGDAGLPLFEYFSNKSMTKRSSAKEIAAKYKSFKNKSDTEKKYTIGSLFFYAKKENESGYKKILASRELSLTECDIVRYIDALKPNTFIWVNGVHYFYNGKIYIEDKLHSDFNNYISYTLYDKLKQTFINVYPEDSDIFSDLIKKLLKLRQHKFKEDCGKTARDELRRDIKFDNNPDILPFNNTVYELNTGEFRDFKYDDYITKTTGYDWIPPTDDEIKRVEHIIAQILFKEDVRKTAMCYLSTGISGHQLQHIAFFTGKGGNGKSWINKMMSAAMGDNFFYTCDNSILTSKKQSASADPNIANMHDKRIVYIEEPESDEPMKNSIIKRLTGNNKINARALYDNGNQKILRCTLAVELNELPNLATTATGAEGRRYYIILFEAEFTTKEHLVNEEKHIYKIDRKLSQEKFVEQHKRAFMFLLMRYYKMYLDNDNEIPVAAEVEEETNNYLKHSDELSEVLENILIEDDNKEVDVKDIYESLPDKFRNKMTFRLFTEKLKKMYHFSDYYVKGDKHNKAKLIKYKLIYDNIVTDD